MDEYGFVPSRQPKSAIPLSDADEAKKIEFEVIYRKKMSRQWKLWEDYLVRHDKLTLTPGKERDRENTGRKKEGKKEGEYMLY